MFNLARKESNHCSNMPHIPHAGYSEQDFTNFFEHLHSALHDAYMDGHCMILEEMWGNVVSSLQVYVLGLDR